MIKRNKTKKGIIYSIIGMIAITTLFIYISAYLSSQSVKKEDSLDFIYSNMINNVINDIQLDLMTISDIKINESENNLIFAYNKPINYSSYIDFLNNVYSKNMNLNLKINLDDSYITKNYVFSYKKINITNGNSLKLNITLNIDNYSIINQNLILGDYNVELNFYNNTNDFLFFINQNINISKSQDIILSNQSNITINNNVFTFNIPINHSYDLYLDKNSSIYFNSFFNMSLKNYGYSDRIRIK